MQRVAWIGMDTHRDSITAATLVDNAEEHVDVRRFVNNRQGVIRYVKRIARLLGKQHGEDAETPWELRFCYEASGGGYVVQRWIEAIRLSNVTLRCMVVAPSKVPRKPGERVKNDRRDARSLASWLRAGELTAVHVPSQEEEGVRSLTRLQHTLTQEIVRSKNHALKFLTVRGHVYREGTNWTQKHWA